VNRKIINHFFFGQWIVSHQGWWLKTSGLFSNRSSIMLDIVFLNLRCQPNVKAWEHSAFLSILFCMKVQISKRLMRDYLFKSFKWKLNRKQTLFYFNFISTREEAISILLLRAKLLKLWSNWEPKIDFFLFSLVSLNCFSDWIQNIKKVQIFFLLMIELSIHFKVKHDILIQQQKNKLWLRGTCWRISLEHQHEVPATIPLEISFIQTDRKWNEENKKFDTSIQFTKV
jgi:hypothetical protein